MNDTSDAPLSGADHSPETPLIDDRAPEETTTPASAGETEETDHRFKEGELLRLIRVRFPGNNRSFPFLVERHDYGYGQRVVAMSDKGLAVGYVNSFPYEARFHKGLLPLRTITKLATDEDLRAEEDTFRREKRLAEICQKHVDRNQLDMVITHVELTQMGKKAVFHFTAPTRIDFRGLVHDVVGELKMRVELRQVSVRDRSSAMGGLGPCGRELCCSSFLSKYGNVGIKLAKNQDLSLNSSKINGVCGQLKCCLTYEDEVYAQKRKKLPKDNGLAKTKDGNRGKVIRLHILLDQFEIINPEGVIRRYTADMWDGHPGEGFEMPRYFENGINDQSKTVIGLDAVLAAQADEHARDLQEAKGRAKDWADEVFQELFGEKTLGLSLPEVAEPETGVRRPVIAEEEEEIAYVAPEEDLLDDEDGDEDEGEGSDDEEGDDESPEGSPVDQMLSPNLLPRLDEPPAERPPLRPDNRAEPRRDQRPQRHDQRHERPDHRRDGGGRPDNRGSRPDGQRSPEQRAQGPRDGQRQDGPRDPNGGGGGGQRRRRRGGRGGRGGGGGGGGGQRPPQG